MGLAGPRKRTKISHDPNNTHWSRSTTGFGHRILTSQGWSPGSYLGPKAASHAEFHSAANASHIRVTLKDDNLGLGAKRGGEDKATGLDAFQGLLGRLNGKTDGEIEKEQKSRDDLQRKLYTERRWGSVAFVRGGLLVGDKIEEIHIEGSKVGGDSTTSGAIAKEPSKQELLKVSPIRTTLEVETSTDAENAKDTRDKLDRSTKELRLKSKKRKDRKSKSSKLAEGSAEHMDTSVVSLEPNCSASDSVDNKVSDMERKDREHRRQRKLERRERKEAKRAKRELRLKAADRRIDESSPNNDSPLREVELATDSGSNSPMVGQGIHGVRQRYIRQKRMAMMDSKALNEILMIKA